MIRGGRRSIALGMTACMAMGSAVLAMASSPAGASPPAVPDTAAAVAGSSWLVSQLTPQGYIPSPTPGQANLAQTANVVLALAATGSAPASAQSALAYMASHIDAYVIVDGADGPGQLALLLLDAVALGENPHSFGGTDLVSRLLATEQDAGADAGAFGTARQFTDQYASTYTQGLALAALAAAGVRGTPQVAASVSWLVGQQCPTSSGTSAGGWTSPEQPTNTCTLDPANYGGPDTNSTALAVEGLAAQGALTAPVSSSALTFLLSAQQSDGGFSYFPSTTSVPATTDSNSTAEVLQAIVALGDSPTSARFTVTGRGNPLTSLLSFQATSGAAAGGFFYQSGGTPDPVSSYEAVPAVMGLAFPYEGASWAVASDGGVFALGTASFFGSMGGKALNAPVVGIAGSSDGGGYWEVASDGGVFAFGDAHFHGSMGGQHLNKPVVGIAATHDGGGYWEVASDGGVFIFCDAHFHGSMGGKALNAPIVGIAATSDGGGYWEVASDGGVFAFGDAIFQGSMGGKHLNKPVVGIAATADGGGYWEVASDGGVFAFGDANPYGSLGAMPPNDPVVGILPTASGTGYLEVTSAGGVFPFGSAYAYGSLAGVPLAAPVVGLASAAGTTT